MPDSVIPDSVVPDSTFACYAQFRCARFPQAVPEAVRHLTRISAEDPNARRLRSQSQSQVPRPYGAASLTLSTPSTSCVLIVLSVKVPQVCLTVKSRQLMRIYDTCRSTSSGGPAYASSPNASGSPPLLAPPLWSQIPPLVWAVSTPNA